MRRLLALLLVLSSSWLLYHALGPLSGLDPIAMPRAIASASNDAGFMMPFMGALLGLLGGLTAFLGGAGGATIALIGALIGAGFSMSAGQSFDFPAHRFWENDALVGLGMVGIALLAAMVPQSGD